jgi:hypothetical protein
MLKILENFYHLINPNTEYDINADADGEDLKGKKLLGSGGYAFAKLTEQEEIKAHLGIPQIFLGNIGRLCRHYLSVLGLNGLRDQ